MFNGLNYDQVLHILVHNWTYSDARLVIEYADIGNLLMVSKSFNSEIRSVTSGNNRKLVKAVLDQQIPLFMKSHECIGIDANLDMVYGSYIHIPRLVDCVRAIERGARVNALNILVRTGTVSSNAEADGTSINDNVGVLMRCFMNGSLWKSFDEKHVLDGKEMCQSKSMFTFIVLSILLSLAIEVYNNISLTDNWSCIYLYPHQQSMPPFPTMHTSISTEERLARNVDFRLHATYAFFSFVGTTFSCDTLNNGRVFGEHVAMIIHGQLVGTLTNRWNEENKRVFAKVKWLLQRVHRKLVRAYGGVQLIIQINGHVNDNE
jgi:hypothetical protein